MYLCLLAIFLKFCSAFACMSICNISGGYFDAGGVVCYRSQTISSIFYNGNANCQTTNVAGVVGHLAIIPTKALFDNLVSAGIFISGETLLGNKKSRLSFNAACANSLINVSMLLHARVKNKLGSACVSLLL